MIFAPTPEDEFLRMQDLRSLNILDTPQDVRFDCIARFAAQLLDAPICLISMIDVDRQWFKSTYGLEDIELPRNTSICGHAICTVKVDAMFDRIFEVCDTKEDKRFF